MKQSGDSLGGAERRPATEGASSSLARPTYSQRRSYRKQLQRLDKKLAWFDVESKDKLWMHQTKGVIHKKYDHIYQLKLLDLMRRDVRLKLKGYKVKP